MPPKRSAAPRISDSISPARDTSATFASTSPSPRSSRDAASTLAASFEQKTTLAPPRASRSTVARPIPVDPPVTTATRPLKSASSLTLRLLGPGRGERCYGLRPSGRISSLSLVARPGRRARRAFQRRDRLLARRVERLHRPPDLVHAVGEQVADQQVGDRALQVREVFDEPAEAEAVVVLAHQPAHAVHALVERRRPTCRAAPPTCRPSPAPRRSRRRPARPTSAPAARPTSRADRGSRRRRRPAPSRRRPPASSDRNSPWWRSSRSRASRFDDALLDRRAALDLLVVGLLVAAAALEQVVERRDDADADDVVVLRDVPEPALACSAVWMTSVAPSSRPVSR